MFFDLIGNPVLISVAILLFLSVIRLNVVFALAGQIWMDSLVIAALAGILVFVIAGVISLRGTQDVFVRGVHLMGGIGIIMIAANGFAEVMKATGSVNSLVELVTGIGDQRGLAVFLMLLIGLIITMGIGSSFSTVPLIAAIYVPLCVKLGLSPLAVIAIVGTAGALGDAGSPVSESVLGPYGGLECGWTARSYLRFDDTDVHSLQSAAPGRQLDRGNASVIRRRGRPACRILIEPSS